MKVTINNNTELLAHYTAQHIKPAAKIQKVLAAIINHAKSEGEDDIEIAIHSDLLAHSYTIVPAMLARSVAPNVDYLSTQAYYDGDTVTLIASDTPQARTFKRQVINRLTTHSRAVVLRKDMPKSYRMRPTLLATVIGKELGQKIATIAKRRKVIWKLTTNGK